MHRALPLALSLVFSSLAVPGSAQAPSIYQRPISGTAAVTGSPKLRDGEFQVAGTAAMCGVIPKESSMTGEATFVIETSDGLKGSVTTITFGSKQLAVTPNGASRFLLTVGMVTANGGRPPNYVLNTEPPTRAGNSGTASLTTVKGVTTLKVVGTNDAKESIELLVTCG